MTETIILDLDGPLLEGVDRHYACYRGILCGHGLRPLAKAPYWAAKRAQRNRRELLSQSGAAQLDDEFLACWLATIESAELLALDRLQPEVLQILDRWKQAGMRLILATMRNDRENTLRQLDQLGLLPFFDHVFITGSNHAGGKTAAVRDTLPRAPDGAASAVWVGDTEVDIQAARELRLPVYAVTCGLRSARLLRQYRPDYLVRDLRAVRDAICREADVQQRVA